MKCARQKDQFKNVVQSRIKSRESNKSEIHFHTRNDYKSEVVQTRTLFMFLFLFLVHATHYRMNESLHKHIGNTLVMAHKNQPRHPKL